MPELIWGGFGNKIDFAGSTVFATTASISESASVLESGGAYGGKLAVGTDMGVAAPLLNDYGDVSGALSFELTGTQLANIIAWIQDRNSSLPITIYTSVDDYLTYDTCFFNSITLSASESSLVTADLNLWMYKDALNGGKIGGAVTKYGMSYGTNLDKNVIPYWNTSISGLPLSLMNWSLTISQTLVKKFYCEGFDPTDPANDDAKAPKAIFVGPFMVDLDVTCILDSTEVDYSSLKNIASLGLKIANTTVINMEKAKLLTMSPDFTNHDQRTVSITYKGFQKVSFI